jgi:mRNA interferase RelE/StbE
VASEYAIEIAPTGYGSLRAIRNKKILGEIVQAIDALARHPETQGKALLHPLEGVRSIRAARDRYRILYRVDPESRRASVLLAGERRPGEERDVYAVAQRLLRALRGER